MTRLEAFANPDTLADTAADVLAEHLSAADARTFVAAGGSTPQPLYDRLAMRDIDWRRLTVTLTDERWVDRGSDDSNEKMLRARLLVGDAARASFLPLKGEGRTPAADAEAVDASLQGLLPSACVLLGMGADGHVASLFPGAPELSRGLDLDGDRFCIAIARSGLKPFTPRISLTARALVSSGLVLILVTGAEKRDVIDRILADPAYAPPAAAILRQTRAPVRVMWAP